MPKIAVVTQTFPVREQPYRGHSVYQTLLRLKRWADVEVVSPQARYPSWLLPRNRTWARTDGSFCPPDFVTHYVPYPAIPVLTRPLNGWVCARWLRLHVEAVKPDLILNYWVYPDGYAAVRIARWLGVPVVVKAIGSDINRSQDIISKVMIKRVMQMANAVLTVSQDLRNKVIAMGIDPAKVTAIPNGCDVAVFRPRDRNQARQELGLREQDRVILYVGRMDVRKGLRELIAAGAALAEEFRTLKIIFVGDGPDSAELEKYVEQINARPFTMFAGVHTTENVARWVAAADVAALPSYSEGCPNTIIEALSCGRPVVATRVGGIPELVNEKVGLLVEPRNVDSLRAALRAALQRSWDEADIARTSTRSWEKVAAETFAVCESLLLRPTQRVLQGGVLAEQAGNRVLV